MFFSSSTISYLYSPRMLPFNFKTLENQKSNFVYFDRLVDVTCWCTQPFVRHIAVFFLPFTLPFFIYYQILLVFIHFYFSLLRNRLQTHHYTYRHKHVSRHIFSAPIPSCSFFSFVLICIIKTVLQLSSTLFLAFRLDFHLILGCGHLESVANDLQMLFCHLVRISTIFKGCCLLHFAFVMAKEIYVSIFNFLTCLRLLVFFSFIFGLTLSCSYTSSLLLWFSYILPQVRRRRRRRRRRRH